MSKVLSPETYRFFSVITSNTQFTCLIRDLFVLYCIVCINSISLNLCLISFIMYWVTALLYFCLRKSFYPFINYLPGFSLKLSVPDEWKLCCSVFRILIVDVLYYFPLIFLFFFYICYVQFSYSTDLVNGSSCIW